ncbi:MAG: hypothetical protein WCA27_23955 [Candidatus Sulfotelmatobacter sp.]
MKSLWFAVIILCIFQIGCNKSGSAPSQQQTVDEADRAICNKHQARAGACGEYKVLSYDATWENGLGNQGAYVLERDGLTIHAHCGCDDCSDFADAVGTIVIADKSIGNLVTRYEPLCEDPLYVKNALEAKKRYTGRDANWATVCQTTLIVDKVEANQTSGNQARNEGGSVMSIGTVIGAVFFGVVGLAFSTFYSWYAITIHLATKDQPYGQLDTPCKPRQSPPPHWSWWAHQLWFNFFGSATGWAALAYLVYYRVPSFHQPNGWKVDFGLADVFFVLLALLGITGILPWRLFNTSLK